MRSSRIRVTEQGKASKIAVFWRLCFSPFSAAFYLYWLARGVKDFERTDTFFGKQISGSYAGQVNISLITNNYCLLSATHTDLRLFPQTPYILARMEFIRASSTWADKKGESHKC